MQGYILVPQSGLYKELDSPARNPLAPDIIDRGLSRLQHSCIVISKGLHLSNVSYLGVNFQSPNVRVLGDCGFG